MGGCGSSEKKAHRDTLHTPRLGEGSGDKKEIKMKLCLSGEVGVGKSVFYHSYFGTMEKFNNSSTPASGDNNCKKLELPDHGTVMLSIWDTAGQDRYKAITRIFFKGADGIILLFDVTSRDSMEKIEKEWIELLKKELDLSNVVLCLVANKTDLPNRAVSKEEGEAFARSKGMLYAEASALQKIGVTEAVSMAVNKVLANPNRPRQSGL